MVTSVHTRAIQMVILHDGTEIDLGVLQGLWTEEQYLRVADDTNHLIEFTEGVLELPPMATSKHQAILGLLLRAFHAVLRARNGTISFGGLPLRLRAGKYREPDLLALLDARDPRRQNACWFGADLVLEVVSPDDPTRDTQLKRGDYAEARIPEYWIVNPLEDTITVLRLAGAQYAEHGVFRRGERATSALLPEFAAAVDEVFDAK